jgi:hypothetical protein
VADYHRQNNSPRKKKRQNSNSGVKYVSSIRSDFFEVKGGRMLSGKLLKLFILGVVLIVGIIPCLAEAG